MKFAWGSSGSIPGLPAQKSAWMKALYISGTISKQWALWKLALTPASSVNYCQALLSVHKVNGLVFSRPAHLAFGSLAMACAFDFSLLDILLLIPKGIREKKGRLFAQLMVLEKAI